MKALKILFAASEVVPFAKTGGLADVAGALPKALKNLGHEVIVVMPRYYGIDKEKYQLTPIEGALGVPMGSLGEFWAEVYTGVLPGSDVPVYFIDYEQYFGRKGLYDEEGHGYEDNSERFIFFSKAVFQLAQKLHFFPDIIHANDWHTAAIPLLLKTRYAGVENFSATASVLTIHNLNYQGHAPAESVNWMEVPWEEFNPASIESFGGVNLLKGGIAHCDMLTTVSETYAKEIQTSEYGHGLEEHIKGHAHKLMGIVNGIDYAEWHPSSDPLIPAHFDVNDLSGKNSCKAALQAQFGLAQDPMTPLFGFVGRLVEQKGISLISTVIHEMLALDIQVVLLGTGEAWAESFFSEIAKQYHGKFACHIGYNNAIAHQIEAGSDMFLMPSLFEPCGLNQIYSLSYGTLPIVRATGGLDDTIENLDVEAGSGNGFKFWEASPHALLETVKWACDVWYKEPEVIDAMRIRAMNASFSWESSGSQYAQVYAYALNNAGVSE
jgi:starch synthase